jgi:hypothetical protein
MNGAVGDGNWQNVAILTGAGTVNSNAAIATGNLDLHS